MITLIIYYRLWLIVAFLIGLATAWWAWGRAPRMAEPRHKARAEVPGTPAPETKPPASGEPVAPAVADGDDLTRIKGIDPETASMLHLLGIRQYGEIANWTREEAEQLTVLLGVGPGRITENKWMEQARLLASGDRVAFELRFGHL